MMYYRPAEQRGRANFGWLDSKHSFSFGSYYDPRHMGVSALRVINDDTVAAGAGFDTHGHRDMEIISYVLEGAIAHKDSMGNEFVVPAGEIQRMTAGTGVTHSEYNHSKSEQLKFLQIWVQPKFTGLKPGYEQKKIEQNGAVTPLVTPDGRDGSLMIHQDASMSRVVLSSGERACLAVHEQTGYLHVIEGSAQAGEQSVSQGDGLALSNATLDLKAGSEGLIALWFELPETRLIGSAIQ